MAEFKKINEVPVIEEPIEGDTLVIISEGELKQISASTFAAASSGGGLAPVYVYEANTDGGSSVVAVAWTNGNKVSIYDPNGVGITNGTELYQYMYSGGSVYAIGVTYWTNGASVENKDAFVCSVISMCPSSDKSVYYGCVYVPSQTSAELKTFTIDA